MIQPWTLIRLQTSYRTQKYITKTHRFLVSEGVISGGLDRCFWAHTYHMPSSRKACFLPQWVTILVCSVFTVSSPEAETVPSSFPEEDSETSGRSSLSSLHASIFPLWPFLLSHCWGRSQVGKLAAWPLRRGNFFSPKVLWNLKNMYPSLFPGVFPVEDTCW